MVNVKRNTGSGASRSMWKLSTVNDAGTTDAMTPKITNRHQASISLRRISNHRLETTRSAVIVSIAGGPGRWTISLTLECSETKSLQGFKLLNKCLPNSKIVCVQELSGVTKLI